MPVRELYTCGRERGDFSPAPPGGAGRPEGQNLEALATCGSLSPTVHRPILSIIRSISILNILGKKILSQVEKAAPELNQLKDQEIIEVGFGI